MWTWQHGWAELSVMVCLALQVAPFATRGSQSDFL